MNGVNCASKLEIKVAQRHLLTGDLCALWRGQVSQALRSKARTIYNQLLVIIMYF